VKRTTCRSFGIARSVLLPTLLIGMLANVVVETCGASGGSGTFALTGSLNTARYNHTATLLPKRRSARDWELTASTHLSLAPSCMTRRRASGP
jgi:hypothetical protein